MNENITRTPRPKKVHAYPKRKPQTGKGMKISQAQTNRVISLVHGFMGQSFTTHRMRKKIKEILEAMKIHLAPVPERATLHYVNTVLSF
jgi:hypothetical protein